MMTCAEMARRLERAAVRARNEIDIPTEALMAHVAEQSKAAIGTYKLGWPQLAAATQADRAAKGYAPNEPLLRTGELRESVEYKAELSPTGAEGLIYSEDKIAVYQELGTSRGIPPRSFLYLPLVQSEEYMASVFRKFAEQILMSE